VRTKNNISIVEVVRPLDLADNNVAVKLSTKEKEGRM
jgi:hypothetical protein